MKTSAQPSYAPLDYRTRAPETLDERPWLERSTGPGWSTSHPCADCHNVQGNLVIFFEYRCGRNGDASTCEELYCGKCERYTVIVTEH